jgi:hypothetical protein
VRPRRIGKRNDMIPNVSGALLQYIVMVAFLRKSPSTCIVLEKYEKYEKKKKLGDLLAPRALQFFSFFLLIGQWGV